MTQLMYLMSKILTEILNPLYETADYFIKSLVHLRADPRKELRFRVFG